jgi:hypothetical protein
MEIRRPFREPVNGPGSVCKGGPVCLGDCRSCRLGRKEGALQTVTGGVPLTADGRFLVILVKL